MFYIQQLIYYIGLKKPTFGLINTTCGLVKPTFGLINTTCGLVKPT